MSHEIEQLADGSAAFVTAREPAWHRLGAVAPGPMTAAEMLDLAQLSGWDVRRGLGMSAMVPTGRCQECNRAEGAKHTQKCPVPGEEGRNTPADDRSVTADDTADLLPIGGWAPVIRTNPVSKDIDVLGVASESYPIITPEELAEFGESIILQSGGAVWETAGSLRAGQDVFMTCKLPEGIRVGGVDDLDLYLALNNNYSGRSALEVITTPVRIVCANTQRVALAGAKSRYAYRHTSQLRDRLEQARTSLRLSFDYSKVFAGQAEAMINTTMTGQQFDRYIAKVWPDRFAGPIAEWRAPQARQFEDLQALFKSADTQENIRGTVWAGWQSVVEWLDWQVPVTGQGEDLVKIQDVRALRTWDGTYDQVKQDAFKLARAVVKAA